MSYCRWSTDDFKCDLYVYEADDGISINVASMRVVGDIPSLDWTNPETLYKTYKEQMDFMDTVKREPINLSQDGESFYGLTHTEAISMLEMLKEEGYNFPQYVIEELMEERRGED